MKTRMIRRGTMTVAFVAAVVCVILLLNFTASNPTGRRYSSTMPLTTGQGTHLQIEENALLILAHDLHMVNNNDAGERLRFCDGEVSEQKLSSKCMAYFPLTAAPGSHTPEVRRPDLVSEAMLVVSKNTQRLKVDTPAFYEIGDDVTGAKLMNRPLWVFVRVDTRVAPKFYRLVQSTGGDIVPYYTVPGFVDPVDRAASIGLAVSLSLLVLMSILEISGTRSKRAVPFAPKPKASRDYSLMQRALRDTDTTEDFLRQREETVRSDINRSDVRNDEE